MSDIRHRMAEAHEAYIAGLFGGVRHPGSGNQLRNQGDGRRSAHRFGLGWVWDCKATIGKSISVSLAQWQKITEQAGTDKPLIPLRMYFNDRLTSHIDLIAMRPDDLLEILELHEVAIKRLDMVRQRLVNMAAEGWVDHPILDSLLPMVDI